MRGRGALVLTSVALLLAASPGPATMIEVETDADDFGTGASGGTCTLREASRPLAPIRRSAAAPRGGKKDTVKLIGNTILQLDGHTATSADGDLDYNRGGGADTICMGKGDDLIQPQAGSDQIAGGPGTDILNYNNAMAGGLFLDLANGIAIGPSIGTDTFTGIEQAQGSEDDDELAGDSGPNRLIGGGGIDAIEGKGGIDLLDAKDGEADLAINCGPGKNSKEKAKFDQGLDPAPLSC